MYPLGLSQLNERLAQGAEDMGTEGGSVSKPLAILRDNSALGFSVVPFVPWALRWQVLSKKDSVVKLTVRHILPLLASPALLLAGCSSAVEAEQSDQSSDSSELGGGVCNVTVLEPAESGQSGQVVANQAATEAALETVILSDDILAAPTATFDAPLDVTSEAVLITNKGKGDTLEEGQILTINYMVCDIATGEKMYSTWGANGDDDTPMSASLTASYLGSSLLEALSGEKVGTRLLWSQPGYSAEESYTGVASNGYIYVMTVNDAMSIPDDISGTEIEPTDESLPAITFEKGKPAVTVPESFTAPTDLVVQPLVEGDGATIEAGQTIAVKYTGWLTDGTQFDSSWDQEEGSQVVSFPIGQGSVITGWDQGLVGQKVGSRLLLVIPSDLGYGQTESGVIPANSDLIFVVDVLAAY